MLVILASVSSVSARVMCRDADIESYERRTTTTTTESGYLTTLYYTSGDCQRRGRQQLRGDADDGITRGCCGSLAELETSVEGFPWGCRRNAEIKMHFRVVLLLLCLQWQKIYQ